MKASKPSALSRINSTSSAARAAASPMKSVRDRLRSPAMRSIIVISIASHGIVQPIVHRLRIQHCINERLAIAHRKIDPLMLVDRAPRRFLQARQHEIRHRAALQGRGTLNQLLLIECDPRNQALALNPTARRLHCRFGQSQSPATDIRPLVGVSILCRHRRRVNQAPDGNQSASKGTARRPSPNCSDTPPS